MATVGLRLLHLLAATCSLQIVCATKRCGYEDENALATREEVESHGKCAVYDRTALDITETPCDRFFKDGVDRFFVANDRHDGDVYRYVNYFDNPQLKLAFKILPQCPEEARRVVCQYFLPPCGNLTMFEPPKSICEDVCDYLLTLCPDTYRAFVDFFKSRPDLIELGFNIFSSCSNTGDFLDFPHCCSDLDIDIPCMVVNGSGELVPDPTCTTSSAASPSPSVVSPSPTMNSGSAASPSPSVESGSTDTGNGGSGGSGGSVGIIAGTTAAIVVMVILAIVVSIAIIMVIRKRKLLKEQLVIKDVLSPPRRSQDSLRYHGNAQFVPPPVGSTLQMAGVKSTYIQQMTEANLLIPGRSLNLMDTVGQGEFGVVYRGNLKDWWTKGQQDLVAVKTLKGLHVLCN